MPLMGTLLSLPQTFSKVTDCIGTFNLPGYSPFAVQKVQKRNFRGA